ncbi:MAG: ribosomal protein S18 acetylase RimI-like enzyme [Paracoccaceae bacterium]|jgi:ribosomal protein S18 acetylase RimI-like enzyme
MVFVRDAVPEYAGSMSIILTEILTSWVSKRSGSPETVVKNYIQNPDRVKCSVAVDENNDIIGFQSLNIARDGNSFDLPVGWGIIGTYVKIDAGRRGTGRALFAASLGAAKVAGLTIIDATISETNDLGLAYYDAMGFRTYRTKRGVICKQLLVSPLDN